ncbi:6-bladed beta-propeller [bacterium]|nr:6-bladed beta-propeller [bacterium]
MLPIKTIILCLLLAANAFPQTTIKNEKERWPSTAELRFEQLLVVGDDETGDESFLVWPFAVRTDADNNIYVSDWKDYGVKVYAPDGRFLRRIGRQGQGPGEFREPEALEIIADSILCVMDDQLISSKMNLFDLEGNFIKSFSITDFSINELILCPWSHELFLTRRTITAQMRAALKRSMDFSIGIYTLDGEEVKRFAPLKGCGTIEKIEHYATNIFVTFQDNGHIVVAWSNPYTMTIYDQQLQPLRQIEGFQQDFAKPAVETLESRERTISLLVENSNVYGLFTLPDRKILTVVCGEEGRYYDLYDPDGVLLKRFPRQRKEVLKHVDREGNWYTVSGIDDVPVVTKYRVEVVVGGK